jgi:5-formyltetrahydrofolate cyclo-ligase
LLWFESNGSHRHLRVALLNSPSLTAARKALRAALNERRRGLSAGERARASLLVARHAAAAVRLRSHWRVALYAALPWELDTQPLIDLARERGCRIYLPRIDRQPAARGMRFVEMRGPWRRNRLGIAEPTGSASLGARWLDVVFLPVVAFDARGLRLGTGGGYYDRAFAYRHVRRAWSGPRLIGLAYAFQQLDSIRAAAHDVPLDAVVTEKGHVPCVTG